MTNIIDIFKIILVIQFFSCTLASYGHPDAEFIDLGSPSQASRDQRIIEAAIKRGMDGEAVAELLRTRKPVVKTTTSPGGFTKTTTYQLEPDGSISSKSILQKRNHYVYNSGSIPDNLKHSPTGTMKRTFIDSNGNKVTQTIAVNRDKSMAVTDIDNLNNDWFNKPFASWPEESKPAPPLAANHRTISRTFSSPSGDRTTIQSWSSEPEFPQPETPLVLTNDTSDFRHTYKRLPPGIGMNWPTFDDPTFPQPWDITEPDDDGWEIVDDPEVTTKKNIESWTPKTWQWPEFPTHPTTTTTTVKPKLYMEPEPSTLRPLPSLDDFLKSQYGQPAKRDSTTSTAKTFTYTPKSLETTTSKVSTSTPKVIKIEDLPVVEVLHNGKPAGEAFLKTLPPHLTPRTPPEHVLKVENKHPVEADVEIYTPKAETNIRTYSKTLIGPEKPKLKDLDPQMQNILKNAGIVPEIEGDSITKTRTEPDGRIITTTYKVNTVPSPPIEYKPVVQHYAPAQFNPFNTDGFATPLSPIAEFLARLGLSKLDISSRNGHYSKTFIDENGDVLTATFVLSSSKNTATGEKLRSKSY